MNYTNSFRDGEGLASRSLPIPAEKRKHVLQVPIVKVFGVSFAFFVLNV